MKTALITGITGQDGAYLAQLLLGKGYTVHGISRNTTGSHLWRLHELGILEHPHLHLIRGDLEDMCALTRLLREILPDEVYNFAATSFVPVTPGQLETMTSATGVGPLRLLEAIRESNPEIRFFQAGSSEMFGRVDTAPQNENTPFHPRNPYGAAKLYAYWNTVIYRENYHIFACNGILFNHESPLRDELFVTRKITQAFAAMRGGSESLLELGNLDSRRDWGYAPEYMEAVWRMLQRKESDCYVLASGRTSSVRDFVELAARAVDIELVWDGSGEKEVGRDRRTGSVRVRVNPVYYRPCEEVELVGDAEKAGRLLDWKASTPLEDICRTMVEMDFNRLQKSV